MDSLTSLEEQVAILIAKGYENKEISRDLYMSLRNVAIHIKSIKNKWNVRSRVEIGILVYHQKLLEHEQETYLQFKRGINYQ